MMCAHREERGPVHMSGNDSKTGTAEVNLCTMSYCFAAGNYDLEHEARSL